MATAGGPGRVGRRASRRAPPGVSAAAGRRLSAGGFGGGRPAEDEGGGEAAGRRNIIGAEVGNFYLHKCSTFSPISTSVKYYIPTGNIPGGNPSLFPALLVLSFPFIAPRNFMLSFCPPAFPSKFPPLFLTRIAPPPISVHLCPKFSFAVPGSPAVRSYFSCGWLYVR